MDHIVPRRLWLDGSQVVEVVDGLRLRRMPFSEFLEITNGPKDPDDGRNLRGLCASDHSRKTVTSDGGFGRSRSRLVIEDGRGPWNEGGK